jgi:putative ABC transport system substrate-binding protein
MRWLALISLVAAGALTKPFPLSAQQAAMPVIGVLSSASAELRDGEQFAAFHSGLKEAGYVNGQNITIEYRWANDDYARLPALAKELVDRKIAVLVAAGGTVSALAAHRATKDIPIVFTPVTDPVKSGLVASLNRPGGNVTGIAGLTTELDPKRLELLHEFNPIARVIGVLVDPERPGITEQRANLQATADKMKLALAFEGAANGREIDTAFESLSRQQPGALLVTADPFFNSHREQVVALSARYAIPTIYQWREFVIAGGLMSYGPSLTDSYREAGTYAGRLLKGAKPADLPVMRPTKFEVVLNLKTAKTLGLKLTRAQLIRIDTTID